MATRTLRPRRTLKKPVSYFEEESGDPEDDDLFQTPPIEHDKHGDDDGDDHNATKDTGNASKKRKKTQSNKKGSKRSKKSKIKVDNPHLPDEIMAIIASHLHPRELFNLTRAQRSFSKHVTYDMVIRGAMILGWRGKNQKDSLKCAVKTLSSSIRDRKVIVPSPMRLLRLLNGKRCEMPYCNAKTSLNTHFCMSTGTYLCPSCYQSWCMSTDRTRFGAKESWGKGMCIYGWHHTRLWRTPFYEGLTGKRVGPVFSMADADDILFRRKTLEEVMALIDEDDREKFLQVYDETEAIVTPTYGSARKWGVVRPTGTLLNY